MLDGEAKVALQDFPITLTASEGMAVMPASAKADKFGAFTLDHVTPLRTISRSSFTARHLREIGDVQRSRGVGADIGPFGRYFRHIADFARY